MNVWYYPRKDIQIDEFSKLSLLGSVPVQKQAFHLINRFVKLLAVDYGFVILEKRFVDVTRRYGIMEGYIKGWEIAFKIKEDFEERMGCSIYDVLPDIGRTTLLTPKPWKPPVK